MSTFAPIAAFKVPEIATISRSQLLWLTMKRKPLGAVSAALLLVIVLTALFAPVSRPTIR
jgi:hypothetical protein